MSATKEKILLLLLGGIAFGFAYTPQRKWRLIKGISKEWGKIKRKELHKEIRSLHRSKLVGKNKDVDGIVSLDLTEKGKLKALTYYFKEIKIKEQIWDGKWRLVIFDVPEKLKTGRDALRRKIKELGFYELQKSVFIFPYKCEDEINFIVDYFGLGDYVKCGVLDSINNDKNIRENFGLDIKPQCVKATL